MHREPGLRLLQMEGGSKLFIELRLKMSSYNSFRPTRRPPGDCVTCCRSSTSQRRTGGLDQEIVDILICSRYHKDHEIVETLKSYFHNIIETESVSNLFKSNKLDNVKCPDVLQISL